MGKKPNLGVEIELGKELQRKISSNCWRADESPNYGIYKLGNQAYALPGVNTTQGLEAGLSAGRRKRNEGRTVI